MEVSRGEAGPLPIPLINTKCIATNEQIRENIRSALGRKLPEVRRCNRHSLQMSVVGGGPSLEDTFGKLTGYIASVNKAHDWLLEQGIVPNACNLLDPMPVVADVITPHKDVTYFVASMCHPSVFDKLKGYHVVLWHASALAGEEDIIVEGLRIGGGCTTALRWLNLGYVCGFRSFHFHGMDSSFPGKRHHVYDYPQDDDLACVELHGFRTHFGLLAQLSDFFRVLKRFREPDIEPVEIEIHGDGLLQHCFEAEYLGRTYTNKEKLC